MVCMHLYSLTLQRASGVTAAVYGSFSAPKKQEIVVAKGGVLELLRPDDNGKVQTVASVEVFGEVRALSCFRLTGGSVDYIVVASDSGRLVILEFNGDKACFQRVHQETYGKSGCRRIVQRLRAVREVNERRIEREVAVRQERCAEAGREG